jgi:hypothetical protein
MGKYGVFDTEAERDAFIAWGDKSLAEEAERLKGIGITDADDLNWKYGQLCHLWETGEVQGPDDVGLTRDEARLFADKVFIIMYGGQWRSEVPEDIKPLFAKVFSRYPKAKDK